MAAAAADTRSTADSDQHRAARHAGRCSASSLSSIAHVLDVPARVRSREAPDASSAAVAFIGLVASIAAIVQRAQSLELLYGVWRPQDAGARPVRTVRQPESPGDMGDHGVPAGVRLSPGPRAAQDAPHHFLPADRKRAEATGHDAHLARCRCVPHDAGRAAVGLAIRPHRTDGCIRAQARR